MPDHINVTNCESLTAGRPFI